MQTANFQQTANIFLYTTMTGQAKVKMTYCDFDELGPVYGPSFCPALPKDTFVIYTFK